MASIGQQHQVANLDTFRLPTEIIIPIFELLGLNDRWALARTSKTFYVIARTHILFLDMVLTLGKWCEFKHETKGYTVLKYMCFIEKLENDLNFIDHARIGGLFRKLEIKLGSSDYRDKISTKDIRTISAILQRTFKSLPNITHVKLEGSDYTSFYTTTICDLFNNCKMLTSFHVEWRWHSPPVSVVGDSEINQIDYLALPDRIPIKSLGIRLYTYGRETYVLSRGRIVRWGENNSILRNAVEPLIRSTISTLHHLTVKLFPFALTSMEMIDWTQLAKSNCSLKVFHYTHSNHIYNGGTFTFDFDTITSSFPNLEELSIRTNSLNIFCGEFNKHHFARLSRCKKIDFELTLLGDPNPPTRYGRAEPILIRLVTDDERMLAALEVRKRIMEEIGLAMPALESFRWLNMRAEDTRGSVSLELNIKRKVQDDVEKDLNFATIVFNPYVLTLESYNNFIDEP